MTVKIDLDGVLYPFEPRFRWWCEKSLGRKLPPAQNYGMWQDWGISKNDFYKLLERFVAAKEFSFGQLPIGALEALLSMKKQGIHIHIVTKRGVRTANTIIRDTWFTDTIRWLSSSQIPYDSLTFTADKHLIEGILIDDCLENLYEAQKAGQTAICFDQPWNREWEGPRIASWKELKIKSHE